MNIITLENISKTYSEKVLLRCILGISDSDKIGLIGINGGNPTLLKIIGGRRIL